MKIQIYPDDATWHPEGDVCHSVSQVVSEVEGLIEVLHLKTINKHKSGSFAFPRDDDIVGVGETMTVIQIGYG